MMHVDRCDSFYIRIGDFLLIRSDRRYRWSNKPSSNRPTVNIGRIAPGVCLICPQIRNSIVRCIYCASANIAQGCKWQSRMVVCSTRIYIKKNKLKLREIEIWPICEIYIRWNVRVKQTNLSNINATVTRRILLQLLSAFTLSIL